MAANRLIRCLQILRARAPGLNLQEALALLYIAQHPGATVTQLASWLGVSGSSASRYSRALAAPEEAFARPPSWGFVVIAAHADARCVALWPSQSGAALVAELDATLGREELQREDAIGHI